MPAASRADLLELPVIDIARLPHDPAALAAIDAACRAWGSFTIRGYDQVSTMTPALVTRLQATMRDFFAQDASVKHAVERTAENTWGYYDRELTKNTRDWKEIYDIGPANGTNVPQWPAAPESFREVITAYAAACESLALVLLRAISACLGMPANFLDAEFREHTSFLRLNHYPPCPAPAAPQAASGTGSHHFGINHHTDAGAITILSQDSQPGLQLLGAGTWHLVAPEPGALTINIGDIVQVWSNDRYTAPLHRVLAHGSAHRYSAPYFFNPARTTNYAPLPSLCRDAPPRYRAINWGEFRAGRAAGDYADVGAEIQISDFRT